MLARRRQSMDILSVSALDLFASALGTFMLLVIMLFPYYLKEPVRQAEEEQAFSNQAAAVSTLEALQARLTQARAAAQAAETARSAAEDRQKKAAETAAAARGRLAAAEAEAVQTPRVAPPPMPERKRHGALKIDDLDVVFVVDATGSMKDEIADVRANLIGIIRVLARLSSSLRVGFVAYKDRGEEFVTRSFPLSPMDAANAERLMFFVNGLTAKGGGDVPEPVDAALRDAVDMAWRPNALGQIIIVGDAPVHAARARDTLGLAESFHRSGSGRTVSTIFTGNDRAVQAFFSNLARTGGGDFSNHSGQMIESVLLSVLKTARS
jgi:multidrug efflux pump subunit AcrA (membrane-fusion protein)